MADFDIETIRAEIRAMDFVRNVFGSRNVAG